MFQLKKIYLILIFFSSCIVFSQQTEGFKKIRKEYDDKIKQEWEKYSEAKKKTKRKKELEKIFENYAIATNELEIQRNKAYLQELIIQKNIANETKNDEQTLYNNDLEIKPTYPGGINYFRTEISNRFNNQLFGGEGKLSTILSFIVEKDGSLSNVTSTGVSRYFNQQAEIALYLTEKKWSPAVILGETVRCRISVPITMHLDE